MIGDLSIAFGRVAFVMLFVLNLGGLLTWVEREGTYTNFDGWVQRFRAAVEPLGQALPEWDILGRVLQALGVEASAPRAERWFRELAGAVPVFAGLTYQSIGDGGAKLR